MFRTAVTVLVRRSLQSNVRAVSLRKLATASSGIPGMESMMDTSSFQSIRYWVADKVAHIQLNRPERMNAINVFTPIELEKAVEVANLDDSVKVILLSGNKVFCSGYDLKDFAEASKRGGFNQKMPWDPYLDYKIMSRCNRAWMSLWRSDKPVVCKINGVAIGGGSDMALCCDVTFISEDALIGYPPSRVWGCPTTAMWFYRLGMEKAKRILFTGQILTGKQAAEIGLVGEAVPADQLDDVVDKFIQRIITVPTNQLFFQKQVINQAVEQMGLTGTQRLATVFDGCSRHTPEGVAFKERCEEVGFKKAVQERDMGVDAVWSNMGGDSKSKL